MSQFDIMDFLKENNHRWWTPREMENKINIPKDIITTNLKRVKKFKFIPLKFRKREQQKGYRVYEYKWGEK